MNIGIDTSETTVPAQRWRLIDDRGDSQIRSDPRFGGSTESAHEPPSGINFRSAELEDVSWNQAQHVLNACADTLESLTITPRRSGTH